MSLKFLQAQDVIAYGNAIQAAQSLTFDVEIAGSGFSSLIGDFRYHEGFDRYLAIVWTDASGVDRALGKLDPFFFETSAPSVLIVPTSITQGDAANRNWAFINLGQFNPTTGQQKIYTQVSSSLGVRDVNLVTLKVGGITWPTGVGDFTIFSSDAAPGAGFWTALDSSALFFEGLTDGIPGETNLIGPNVYPSGLVLRHCTAGTYPFVINGGTTAANGPGWINPETRRLEGGPSVFPVDVDSTPSGNFAEEEIGGDEFEWMFQQYLPDADATFSIPKGQLLFISRQEMPSVPPPPPTGSMRIYMRLSDFNPFNVASVSGVTTRTHGRQRLTSRMFQPIDPIQYDVAGSVAILNARAERSIQWDPLRRRFVAFLWAGSVADEGTVPLRATVGFFAAQPAVAIVTNPAARDVPRTNDVATFEAFAGGDLSEPIPSVEIDWTLNRASTEGEVLDATTFPGSSTVANPPIDDSVPSSNEGTLLVWADGVPLAETVDFTVVLATGVITWVTDQSGATLVTCNYEHRATEVAPAHGTLLSASSVTDENGNAQTQVAYDDNDALVGTLDHLDASEA